MTVDHKIIEDCKAGKRRAQSRLYKAYAGAMLGICLRYCTSRAEAEDILQEGFIKVFSNITQLKENAALGAWIRTIMVNTAITHARRNKIDFYEINEDIIADPEQDENTLLPIKPEALISMIQELPHGYRMVLNLYVFENFSHKEIAAKLNISESTSKSQLFKARKAIRKAVENMNLNNNNLVKNEARI